MASMNTIRHFESFNARFLKPREVGETFVRPPFLKDIAASSNTAILGPRGSGKTTLLKMLTLPALLSWTDPGRDELASQLDYLSIYIPSTLTWNADYRRFSGAELSKPVSDLISISLFRHNVLFSLLNAWREAARPEVQKNEYLKRLSLPIYPEKEAEFVRKLAKHWQLEVPISTISGLRDGISERLRLLQRLTVRAGYVGTQLEQLLDDWPFLGAHFLDDCCAFADFIQDAYPNIEKFALCFDEVEIAPDEIANAILKMPRSIDQRFLVKFSAAPYVGISSALKGSIVPTQRQDYTFVLLSSYSTRETRTFSDKLFTSLAGKFWVARGADEVLGSSLIDDDGSDGNQIASRRYHNAGAYQRRFKALVETDRSFERYVLQKSINVNDLTVGTSNERAALIRKIIWPVLIREEFLYRPTVVDNASQSKRRIRTANAISDIYTGAASLFAICEGNPRQIIGLMEPMLRAVEVGAVSSSGTVRRSLQKRLVERMISAYFALIATVPIREKSWGVGSLVDMISVVGTYFKDTVLGREFNPDPVLSFEIDDQLPPSIKELVGRGINIGAFVLADVTKAGGSPYHLGDITGLRARLSNIFAPHFRLPLTGGRTVNLSTILRRAQSHPPPQPLLELFGEKL
jgi:hypothetical protein